MATQMKINESREIFDLANLNGDGPIDLHEFQVRLNVLDGDESRAERELDFEVLHTEGDGYIELKEFVAWWTN